MQLIHPLKVPGKSSKLGVYRCDSQPFNVSNRGETETTKKVA